MNKRRGIPVVLLAVTVLACIAYELVFNGASPGTTAGKPRWAVAMELEGVPNLHKVSNDLYRSAQPTAAGMRNLEAMGIRTIINLRSFHSDRDEIKGTTLGYFHMTMKAWHPEEKEAREFIRIISDPNNLPAVVHCQHGSDRTGAMCAIYRIAVQGWSREEAIREMTEGGFGFHEIWSNLPGWVGQLDMEELR